MRLRRIAILIDAGFFLKHLPKLIQSDAPLSAAETAEWARKLCKRLVQRITGESPRVRNSRWLDHVYRLFYYDAAPYDGVSHHPVTNLRVDYRKTETALFRESVFAELRRKRKFALRLGKVNKDNEWTISPKLTKGLLKTRQFHEVLAALASGSAIPVLSDSDKAALGKLAALWSGLGEKDVSLGLRQKGVDMRIGIDIATLTLKKQVDTIVLVTGDSDFVPAAKLARREGVEFLLDPLWQSVNDDLYEHVDGVVSGIARPGDTETPDDGASPAEPAPPTASTDS